MNKSVENAFFHVSLINKMFQASCVTFQQQYRVPPGDEYGVGLCMVESYRIRSYILILTFTAGHVS